MRLREISWKNYRRLPDGQIRVRNQLVLVGPNDSGKSSILRALDMSLGMSGSQLVAALDHSDFSDASEPLLIRVTLDDIAEPDRAAFPDEIETQDGETLTIQVDAAADPTDPESLEVTRYFPYAGHTRSPNRLQRERLGWEYVVAARSLGRELAGRDGALRSLLTSLDLESDQGTFDAAIDAFRDALNQSRALTDFRGQLAAALSTVLPRGIEHGDLSLTSQADVLEDPLAGVTVTIADGDRQAPLTEQSDGIRAMSVLALLSLAHETARVVGIDEPETFLHPSAQRAIAGIMRRAPGQRVIATHSPAVVSQMDPLDIVRMGPDRVARQLPDDAPMAQIATMIRHWSPLLIEPLTANAVLLVEGPSDRIVCERAAELLDIDLNRHGVIVFELGGSGLFELAHDLLGPDGFDVPMFGLLDEDAVTSWSEVLGLEDLEGDRRYSVCRPDLEANYVGTLGVEAVVDALLGSGLSEGQIRAACGGTDLSELTEDELAAYCRHKKRKVRAALAVSAALDAEDARLLGPVVDILDSVTQS